VLHTLDSGQCFQGVAILCRSGTAEAANHVTFPAARGAHMDINLAALSDILFNKVKRLGHFLGGSRDILPDLLCFNALILA
jgi:hypothetical protein